MFYYQTEIVIISIFVSVLHRNWTWKSRTPKQQSGMSHKNRRWKYLQAELMLRNYSNDWRCLFVFLNVAFYCDCFLWRSCVPLFSLPPFEWQLWQSQTMPLILDWRLLNSLILKFKGNYYKDDVWSQLGRAFNLEWRSQNTREDGAWCYEVFLLSTDRRHERRSDCESWQSFFLILSPFVCS